MCGIAGILSFPPARAPAQAELGAMIGRLGHRGPDGNGTRTDGVIGLGHARLRIIDLPGGQQPIRN